MKFARFVLAPAYAALAACQQSAPVPEATASASAATDPEAKPGIAVSDARLVMPAVAGNPAAAYFTIANSGDVIASIAAVSIQGADKAEMHESKGSSMMPLATVEIGKGAAVQFAPGGKHIMVFGLKPDPGPHSNVEMTLSFADGDKVSVPLAIKAPGGEDPMPEMETPESH